MIVLPTTYEPIATTTLSSSQNSVTFSNIPATYTDLLLVAVFTETAAATNTNGYIIFNSDTYNSQTNYSATRMTGDGVTASSSRYSSQGAMYWNFDTSTTTPIVSIFNIMNYANTNVNKTVLFRQGIASVGTMAQVGLWRNTAAINTIKLFGSDQVGVPTADPFAANSSFTLYGIKAA